MVALRLVGAIVAATLFAGCGGDSSPTQLVDGSRAPELPSVLAGLDDAVLTRAVVTTESELDHEELEACGVPEDGGDRTVVNRTGLRGSSLTIGSGRLVFACDKILDPQTAKDPDRPYGGIWCNSSRGRIDDGKLNDPRLSLCQNTDGEIAAFAWIEPEPSATWVVVSDAGHREVYEVTESLPVRVTTTDNVSPAGSASFDVEEYAADGAKLREYTLYARVAG